MTRLNTCRFCKSFMSDDLVKYGTRHYAHYRCYLDSGKTLDKLPAWQVAKFPYFLLKERGLLDHPKVKEALAIEDRCRLQTEFKEAEKLT